MGNKSTKGQAYPQPDHSFLQVEVYQKVLEFVLESVGKFLASPVDDPRSLAKKGVTLTVDNESYRKDKTIFAAWTLVHKTKIFTEILTLTLAFDFGQINHDDVKCHLQYSRGGISLAEESGHTASQLSLSDALKVIKGFFESVVPGEISYPNYLKLSELIECKARVYSSDTPRHERLSCSQVSTD